VTAFKSIRARAEKRKGGPKALARLLPAKPDPKALARLGDDRILAEMTRRVFSAGFAWSVIESKWPGFETAFFGFKPGLVVGKTNTDGTEVESEPYSSQDLMTSTCKALGISLETTYTARNGRPMKIANSGRVIKELFV
jgi:hypothetical protein